jgi:hypothetical protein
MASSQAGRRWARAPHRLALAALLCLLFAAGPRPAHAQVASASDRETARALMQEGDARRDRKDLKGALESYQAADALVHVTTTGFEVARTLAQLGLLVEARDQLAEVMRIPARPNEPSALAEARTAARALSDDLDARIPGIRAVLQGLGPGATAAVSIDGAAIPSAALIAYRRVNPGQHTVVARVGAVERRESVTVKEREKREVTLDVGSPGLAAAAPQPTAPTPARDAPVPVPSPAFASAGSAPAGPWRTLAWTGFGVGAAGLIAGSITGIVSIAKANAAKSVPASQGGCVDDQCGPATHSDIDASVTAGNVSTVAFIAGGAGIALGVTSLIMGRGASSSGPTEPATQGVRLSPWIGLFAGGVSGSF